MDIQTLRKMRNSDFSKIAGEFDKIANPGEKKSYDDDRLWKLTADKAGNASAVIRFLPRTEGDELPFVKIFSHSFQGPTGKWYIQNSLTTLGENDPVGELNSKLWNSGSEANKEVARKQKRKLSFMANIYVVSDPAKPENNGKVFLFKFGKKIFDKIMDKARPTFAEDQPVNVFDLWEGADFKLRMRKVDGYPNYDQSTFADPSALMGGDEEQLLEVVGKQYRLSEFLDRKNFKSYEELSRMLNDVLNENGSAGRSAASMSEDEDDGYVAPVAPKSVGASKPAPEPKVAKNTVADDDEDVMSYFQKIANEG
jgi:hypothetical protein